jgi:SAM-dependent methyltransferase
MGLKLKNTLKKFFEFILESLETVFLVGYRDWQESKSVKDLRNVEKEIFINYFNKSYPLFIRKERKETGYCKFSFTFGETPYPTARIIAQKAEITDKDIIYDLGCGRGKFLFFMNLFTGARCIGIDLIPTYIETANKIVEKIGLKRIEFFREDIMGIDLRTATVVMVHGTTFDMDIHDSIKEKIQQLKPGCRLISISVPYSHPRLTLIEKEDLAFSWGKGTMYLYRV